MAADALRSGRFPRTSPAGCTSAPSLLLPATVAVRRGMISFPEALPVLEVAGEVAKPPDHFLGQVGIHAVLLDLRTPLTRRHALNARHRRAHAVDRLSED